MTAKRVLILDSAGITAQHWNDGHIHHEAEFQPDPIGLEAFGDYLRKHRGSIFYLLADVTEEGFQLEDIPFVQGRDRTALLQRRLGQYYYGTPLSLAVSLGRASEGRRDEKVLFAALTRAEAFAPWLEALRAAESILAGVYSVPLVLAEYGARLADGVLPSLVITVTRGGVRQSFFNRGKLQFSRLSQLATRSLDELGVACATEAGKIHQYLVGQRQIPRGTLLQTRILAHSDQFPSLKEHCVSTPELAYEFIDLSDFARQSGIKDRPVDSRAEALFIHKLASSPPSQQFAAPQERRFYRIWQARFALTSLAWIVLSASLLYAAKTGLIAYDMQQTNNLINVEIAADSQRYKVILDALPKVALTPENLRALIARFDELQKRTPEMEPLLAHLSQALTDTPKIDLLKLEWRASDRGGSGKVGAGDTASSATSGRDSLELTAQLPLGLSSDLRAQLNLIENFTNRLRTPTIEVAVLSLPFDIESGKPLKSRSEQATSQPNEAPKFSLRLVRKP